MTRQLFHVIALWLLAISLLLTCFTIAASAQSSATPRPVRPAHIGLVYPISTNGSEAAQYDNAFSFHLLGGVSCNEQAFILSGISSIVKEDAQGAAISGISNHIGGEAEGVQIAGIANTTGSSYGASIAGVVNISGDATVQIAGVCNIADDCEGLQLSGVANVAQDAGVQVGGLMNKANSVNTQIGGLINIAQKVSGVQVAGLINIAEESDYPIGLINIIKKGERQISVSIDETATTMLSFRSGGRGLYGIVGAGYNWKHERARYALEGGIGLHLPVTKTFRVNVEGVAASMSDFTHEVYFKSSTRLLAAWRPLAGVELFGGPVLSFLNYEEGTNDKLVSNFIWERSKYGNFHGIYLGYMGGIQINL
jgi:hypothetical protein